MMNVFLSRSVKTADDAKLILGSQIISISILRNIKTTSQSFYSWPR